MTKRIILIVISVVVTLWLGATQALPGFVSGELLKSWCSRNEGLDREACYSYLRGASDAFHAIADVSAGDNAGRNISPWPNECMPARISITDLRDVFLDFAARQPDQLGKQAAALLAEILQQSFPCAKASKPDPGIDSGRLGDSEERP
ncbi:MAG TPA: Rap1a/Tai family immunity protein [Gammaproteobacteria bacterium]|nr:Rap1a/Tai family immunity protein [Gammaproteobacteria bacterium]